MAVMAIAHNPDLTIEQVKEIFRKRFEPKYRVEAMGRFGAHCPPRRDFMVVKNPWAGIAVRLEQSDSKTKFVYGGVFARWWAFWIGGFLMAIISMRILLMKEVKDFMRTAPEFSDASPAAAGSRLSTAQVGLPLMSCASCRAPLAGQARFCQVCGTPVSAGEPTPQGACPACGAPAANESRFCQSCGAAIPGAVSTPEPPILPSSAMEQKVSCPRCGIELPRTSLYCHGCGASVTSTG